ncbi:hypothetical protein [Bacillus sp. AK128]
MIRKLLSSILLFTFLLPLLISNKSFAEWANSFVVYDGYVYVVSDEYVTEIEKEIGKVTKHSGIEGTYYGDFSNTYKRGTKYYSIKNVSTEIAIAVDDNGAFIKAIRDGEYAGRSIYSPFYMAIGAILFFVIVTYIVEKKVRKSL